MRKSLNSEMRKRENDRIETENHAFAKRIFSGTSSIKKREMDDFFNKNSEHKHRILKFKKPILGRYGPQLPPLTADRSI